MLDIQLHKTTLIRILKEIYTNPLLRTTLGFKGGTAALLFYDLPRFSVDLDFDLLNLDKKEVVFEKIKNVLVGLGELKQAVDKQNTLFFLLRYQKDFRNLKIEISKRVDFTSYETKHYLGIPVLVMKTEDMAAGKLCALLTRKNFAARDLFDLWFFLKNDWQINEQVVKRKTKMSLKQALKEAEKKIKSVGKTQLLSGLGDLIEPIQKTWIKDKLKDELLFQLKLYQSTRKTIN